MRVIDADALTKQIAITIEDSCMNGLWKQGMNYALGLVKVQPTIQPEIMRCGDGCKFWDKHAGEQKGMCYILRQCTSDNFYCGNAKRREG